jgi:sarcosine oxidase subunit alpha
VGILDASTLGKIDIQGADAREFLNRIYTNAWLKLGVGKCRYGLMCGEDGMVMDDGVTACLADNHFVMTTTTGGAARVLEWLELWHQTEWPELNVYFNTVTDHWATATISGPNARALLSELTDTDLDSDNFPFMAWREGMVADIPGRIFRISFTGELSYEINVNANYGLTLWERLIEAGKKYNLTPYGTETMHVLRAEKGFIIVGQDTDGAVTPEDLGMEWAIAKRKKFSFVGKRGMARADCQRAQRKQLVGLSPIDTSVVLPEVLRLFLSA